MRGVGKRAFLQALDVARASARRIGDRLAVDGVLAEPGDVVYLTATELVDPPPNARELVAERRQQREEQRRVELPVDFQGEPEPVLAESPAELATGPDGERPDRRARR